MTKLGKGGGKCEKGNLDSKEQCTDDPYPAKGVRCCASAGIPSTTTTAINAGATTVKVDDVSGISVGDVLYLSDDDGGTSETKTVVDVSTGTRRMRRGTPPQPGVVTFTPAAINTFPAGSTVAFSGPPSFEWQQERGCCREKVGESMYNHHATVSDIQIFTQSTGYEANLNCTATCASDTACTAIELTVKKGTARCAFHTRAINAAAHGSKSCKKAQCKYKTAYMAPTPEVTSKKGKKAEPSKSSKSKSSKSKSSKSKPSKSTKAPRKRRAAAALEAKQAQAVRLEVGAGVALVGMVGFVALVATKLLASVVPGADAAHLLAATATAPLATAAEASPGMV